MPTEMELTLEQTQQGVSYEVSFDESIANVLERFYTSAGNPVKEILLKLNPPDHRSILTDSKMVVKGPYCTDLPTPEEILRLLELERVVVDRTIKSQTVALNPNQILTKELSPDMKQWEELIRENVFGLGGHQDRLPAYLAHIIECAKATPTANLPYGMLLTRLFRHVIELYPHLDNGIYDVVERIMRPLALRQTRRPRSDRGKARHSVSSTSAHHNLGSSSHQGDDDEDDGASRASTPSPTTYLNSLHPLNYQNYHMPSSSEQTDETLFARQTTLLNQTQ
ncbi:hypothetical protein Tco_0765691 [Tanacetum coccineum]